MACAALVFSVLLLFGCGGGRTSSSQNPNPQPNTSSLQVNIGDGPSDRLVAVSMTIGSMTLANTTGSSVTVVSSPTPVEMMHLNGHHATALVNEGTPGHVLKRHNQHLVGYGHVYGSGHCPASTKDGFGTDVSQLDFQSSFDGG
jgi:hypothetical protein